MRIFEWLQSEFARFWGAILVGMAIGLAGAYAREFNDGRAPNWKWLRNRLLIYPFLSLSAAAAAESTDLTRTQAAFLAAILSLLSFDAVRAITRGWLKSVSDKADDDAVQTDAIRTKDILPIGKATPADKSDGDGLQP